MAYRILADLVMAVHFAFILFVILGGLLALRWRAAAWVHVPCFVWGAAIITVGWVCPLTPLEVSLRRSAGEAGYDGSFIEHYLLPLIYPGELGPAVRWVLGGALLGFNLLVYAAVYRRGRRT